MTEPSTPGTVLALLVSGPPASGKTTLARAVAERIGACLLDLDVVTGALTESIGKLVGQQRIWTRRRSPVTCARARYECLLAAAEDNLRMGLR